MGKIMLRKINTFIHQVNGSVATSIAVMAVPLLIACGAAIDYSSLHNARANLQEAADAASLASAKELGLASTTDATIQTIAKDYALAAITSTLGNQKGIQSSTVKASVSSSRNEVTVDISYTWVPLIIQHLDSTALPIKVSATASLAGEQRICVLALDNSISQAIDMSAQATMTANNCVIYSNSSSSDGIFLSKKSTMVGSEIMSSGGYKGPDSSFNPLPLTDTPIIDDPLKDRVQPTVSGNCDHNNFSSTANVTLSPGVYCGGLNIRDKAIARLLPGDYIIKDGPLAIGGNASLIGEDIGFFLTGSNATFDFGVSTQAVLSARKSGVMSGILFFEDRNSPKDRQFTIRSKDAEKFEGAIYLPKGTLWIDKASRVGQKSSWTAIVAKRIALGKGPNIVINSDYANSSIPVPDGIGGGGRVRLRR